jgi:hypothetical protein
MIFENYDRIVYAGDSVTDMGSTNPLGEGLFDNVGRDLCDIAVGLQIAAGDVQGKLRAIKDTLEHQQILGDNLFDVVGHKDLVVVELNFAFQ